MRIILKNKNSKHFIHHREKYLFLLKFKTQILILKSKYIFMFFVYILPKNFKIIEKMLILNCRGLFSILRGANIFLQSLLPWIFDIFFGSLEFGTTALAWAELEKRKGKPCLILNLACQKKTHFSLGHMVFPGLVNDVY